MILLWSLICMNQEASRLKNNWISNKETRMDKHRETNLSDFFYTLKKHLSAVIIFTLIFGIAGFVSAKFIIPVQYTSNTQILVSQHHSKSSEIFNNQQADVQLVNTYKNIITNNRILSLSRKKLANSGRFDLSTSALKKSVSVKTSQNSQVFTLQAKSHDADESSAIANTVSTVFKHQIKHYMGFDNVTITSQAVTPKKPSFPNVKLFTLGGLLLGLFLGAVYSVVREDN